MNTKNLLFIAVLGFTTWALCTKTREINLGDGMKLVVTEDVGYFMACVKRGTHLISEYSSKDKFVRLRPDLAARCDFPTPPNNFNHSESLSESLKGLSPLQYDAAEQMAQNAKLSANDFIGLTQSAENLQEATRNIQRDMQRGAVSQAEGQRRLDELSQKKLRLFEKAQAAQQSSASPSTQKSSSSSSQQPKQEPPSSKSSVQQQSSSSSSSEQNQYEQELPSLTEVSIEPIVVQPSDAQRVPEKISVAEPRQTSATPSAKPSSFTARTTERVKKFFNDNPTARDSAVMAGKVSLHVASYEIASMLYQKIRGPSAAERAYTQASAEALRNAQERNARLGRLLQKNTPAEDQSQESGMSRIIDARIEELRNKAADFEGLDSPIFENCRAGYSLAAKLQEHGRDDMSNRLEDFFDFVKGMPIGGVREGCDVVRNPVQFVRSMTIGFIESTTKLVRLAAAFDDSFNPRSSDGILGRLFFNSLEEQQLAKQAYKDKIRALLQAFGEMPARKKGEVVGRICADIALQGRLFSVAKTCITLAKNTTRELDLVKRALEVVEDYAKTADEANRFFKKEEALEAAGVGEFLHRPSVGTIENLANFSEASSSIPSTSKGVAQGIADAEALARAEALIKNNPGMGKLAEAYDIETFSEVVKVLKVTESSPPWKIQDLKEYCDIVKDLKRKQSWFDIRIEKGRITENSLIEAAAGMTAEREGFLRGLSRYSKEDSDLLDVLGQQWDVKRGISDLSNGKRVFDIEKLFASIRKKFASNINIILDATKLNDADVKTVLDRIYIDFSSEEVKRFLIINRSNLKMCRKL